MVALAMLVIIAGCAAFLFLKGTLVQGITMILNVIIAGFVALGFYEMLVPLLVKYAAGMAEWAPLICFGLLLILTFAILQTVAMQLGKEKVDLGKLPEQIGRVVCGVILGYVVTGNLLVAAAMAPLPVQYPYPRFEQRNPNPSKPNKAVLSPDGFVTGLFATVSKGSFSGIREPKSFAMLHAGYLDQLYLNRHKLSQKVWTTTNAPAFNASKSSVWPAPDSLRDSDGKPLGARPGENLMLARVELKNRALKEGAKLTLSQIRLVCGPKSGARSSLAGQGTAVYPVGYVGANNRLERKSLDDVIAEESSEAMTAMDAAFYVPANLVPRLLEFRDSNAIPVSLPASGEEAPAMISYPGSSASPKNEPAQPSQPQQEPPAPVPPQPQSREPGHEKTLSEHTRGLVPDQLEN
jgi:hypothetical protein